MSMALWSMDGSRGEGRLGKLRARRLPVQSNFVQTRDLRMHYLQGGAGEPVIFIHGFPETSYEWRHQFAAFSEHYACFAPDLRGFGETEKPGLRVSRQILAQDVVNFM